MAGSLRVLVVSAAAALVAPLVVGVPAVGADPTEQVFAESGEFTVPAGVCAVTAIATGEQGQQAYDQSVGRWGGWGTSARAVLAVTPGEVLGVNVDVGGGPGGAGSNGHEDGGDGGGASDVRRSPFGLGDRVLIGGGGGGAGGGGYGDQVSGAGGPAGGGPTDGWYSDFFTFRGGTAAPGRYGGGDRGGPGGAGARLTDGGIGGGGVHDGALGTGGAGLSAAFGPDGGNGGGGGGGGLYGGAGGAIGPGIGNLLFLTRTNGGGGGGGGSSFGPAGTEFTSNVANPGSAGVVAGSVTISYEPTGTCPDETGPAVEVTTPADAAVYDRGSTVPAAFDCADEAGGSGVESCVGTVADGEPIDTSTAGEFDFTVTGTDVAGNETTVTNTYTVRDGSLSIDLSADEATVAPGGTIHYTVTVTNTGEAPPPTTTTAPTTTSTTAAFNASLVGDPIDLTGVTVTSAAVADCDRDLGDLAAGANVTYPCTHVTAVGDGPTFTNTATVASDQSDPVESTPAEVAVAVPAGSGLVSGTVTETGSGAPVAGARVGVLRTADFSLATAVRTRADGGYTATVAAGDYYLYVIDAVHVAGFYGPPTIVTVTDAATATADPVVAARAGTVTGTVSDSGGPLDGIWVTAIDTNGVVIGDTDTAADGAYTLNGLPAGSYRIRFVDPTGVHPPLYYDQADGYGDAAPVIVTGGAPTTGIDATLAASG